MVAIFLIPLKYYETGLFGSTTHEEGMNHTNTINDFRNGSETEYVRLCEVDRPTHSGSASDIAPNNLPWLSDPFIGRDSEIQNITQVLFNSTWPSPKGILCLHGPPAIGKSVLSIHVGYHVAKRGIAVRYINVNDARHYFTHSGSRATSSTSKAATNTKSFQSAIKLYKGDIAFLEYSNKKAQYDSVSTRDLLEWARKVTSDTLLIIDNCDDLLQGDEATEQEFMELMLALHEASRHGVLKIMVTSRAEMSVRGGKMYPVRGLDNRSALQLLQIEAPLLSREEGEIIAECVDNNPLALIIAAKLVAEKNWPPRVLIRHLKQDPIDTLSPKFLPNSHKLLPLLQMSFDYLDNNTQICSQYLSHFPGSFDHDAGIGILMKLTTITMPKNCLDELTRRSLLHMYWFFNRQRYQFHGLIKEFLHYVSYRNEKEINITQFNFSFQTHYSKSLHSFAEQYNSDHHNEEIIGIFECDFHNFLKLLRMTSKDSSVSSLLDIGYAFQSDLLLELLSENDLLKELQQIVFAFDQNLLIIADDDAEEYVTIYMNLIYKLIKWISKVKDYTSCITTCKETFAIPVHTSRVKAMRKLVLRNLTFFSGLVILDADCHVWGCDPVCNAELPPKLNSAPVHTITVAFITVVVSVILLFALNGYVNMSEHNKVPYLVIIFATSMAVAFLFDGMGFLTPTLSLLVMRPLVKIFVWILFSHLMTQIGCGIIKTVIPLMVSLIVSVVFAELFKVNVYVEVLALSIPFVFCIRKNFRELLIMYSFSISEWQFLMSASANLYPRMIMVYKLLTEAIIPFDDSYLFLFFLLGFISLHLVKSFYHLRSVLLIFIVPYIIFIVVFTLSTVTDSMVVLILAVSCNTIAFIMPVLSHWNQAHVRVFRMCLLFLLVYPSLVLLLYHGGTSAFILSFFLEAVAFNYVATLHSDIFVAMIMTTLVYIASNNVLSVLT